jgi:glycosyltransferase involved in cell wall biosynthesis
MAPDVDLDLLAASLRADSSDLRAFVEGLAVKLEEALPGGLRVERRRSGAFGPKVVTRIVVDAGDQRLELRARDGSIETLCSRLSGGIVLKSERVDTDAWVAALGEALAREAQRSEKTKQALERLLIR